ncbi:MAG: YdbL family protein [Motiliproteus sp.]|nr:YdbL family protein [Motiliproteus sp.]MCW9051846.1 YdbL family protein [Motiliproteus sp.]
MHNVRSLLVCLGLIFTLGLPSTALALSVADAKASGLVGEQSNGYLAAVSDSPSAAVKALVSSTNQKRRSAYQSGAKKAGVSLQVMEQRVGQRLLQKATTGQFFRNPKGGWQKK